MYCYTGASTVLQFSVDSLTIITERDETHLDFPRNSSDTLAIWRLQIIGNLLFLSANHFYTLCGFGQLLARTISLVKGDKLVQMMKIKVYDFLLKIPVARLGSPTDSVLAS